MPPPPPPRIGKAKEGHRHFGGSYDGDYSYTSPQQDMLPTSGNSKTRSRYRREKERPSKYTKA